MHLHFATSSTWTPHRVSAQRRFYHSNIDHIKQNQKTQEDQKLSGKIVKDGRVTKIRAFFHRRFVRKKRVYAPSIVRLYAVFHCTFHFFLHHRRLNVPFPVKHSMTDNACLDSLFHILKFSSYFPITLYKTPHKKFSFLNKRFVPVCNLLSFYAWNNKFYTIY